MYKVFIALFSLLAITACSDTIVDNREYNAPYYPDKYKVEINRLNDQILSSRVLNMYLCDSDIVLNMKNADNNNVFHAFSMQDGTYKGSFAHYGRGYGELNSYNFAAYDDENGILYAIDNGSRYLAMDFRASIKDKIARIKDYDLIKGRNKTRSLHWLNGRLLHCENFDTRLFTTDLQFADTVKLYHQYPYVSPDFEVDSMLRRSYFGTHAHQTVKPDGQKIASVTRFGMLMEIFDIESDRAYLTKLRRFYLPMMENHISASDDCIWGASGICSTNKYIYILYYDVPIDEIDISKRVLGVFDWAGDEVCKYEFDENITNFIVTPDDKRVYCWARDKDAEEYFGYFDLK